jgi:hypothetical protein
VMSSTGVIFTNDQFLKKEIRLDDVAATVDELEREFRA